MRAVRVSWALVPALVAWASPALADDLTLTWKAPAGCPSGEQVRAQALKNSAKAALSTRQLATPVAMLISIKARMVRPSPASIRMNMLTGAAA